MGSHPVDWQAGLQTCGQTGREEAQPPPPPPLLFIVVRTYRPVFFPLHAADALYKSCLTIVMNAALSLSRLLPVFEEEDPDHTRYAGVSNGFQRARGLLR